MEIELTLRTWRMTRGIPKGTHVWFDPSVEYVKLFRLPPRDGEEAVDSLEGVDSRGEIGYLDKVVSVSADGQMRADDPSDYEQGLLFREQDDLPF